MPPGQSVQPGDYAGERSGAPSRSRGWTRIIRTATRSTLPITCWCSYLPPRERDCGGTCSRRNPARQFRRASEAFADPYGAFRLGGCHGHRAAPIGTRSVVIVNTTMAGAFARAGPPLGILEDLPRPRASRQLPGRPRLGREGRAVSGTGTAPGDGTRQRAIIFKPVLRSRCRASRRGCRRGLAFPARYAQRLAPYAWCPAGNDIVGCKDACKGRGRGRGGCPGPLDPLAAVCGRACRPLHGRMQPASSAGGRIHGIERWIAGRIRGEGRHPASAPHRHRRRRAGARAATPWA